VAYQRISESGISGDISLKIWQQASARRRKQLRAAKAVAKTLKTASRIERGGGWRVAK